MKKNSMIIFVVLFSLSFAIFISVKYFNNNRSVVLNEEFSLQKNQVVRVANQEHTNIKLTEIDLVNNKLKYTLQINGKTYYIEEIPSTLNIYEKGQLVVREGDEDRLIVKVVEDN